MEYQNCPHCNTKLTGFFANHALLSQQKTDIINKYSNNKSEAYCNNCGDAIYYKVVGDLKSSLNDLKQEITKQIDILPIVSVQSPVGWDYKIVSIITSQCVIGTGVLSEISSNFSDLFGSRSDSLEEKIRKGELACMNSLRAKAVKLGCNAIIATDIDYAEVGGGKGMLMVCMTGTAVILNNFAEATAIVAEKYEGFIGLINQMLDAEKLLTDAVV